MAWFILTVNILLIFKLWWDKRAKDSGRIINHSLSAAIDGAIYSIAGWFFLGWDVGGWLLIAVGYRWVMFDILFNLINKDKWNHYGKSAWLDRQLTKLGKFHLVPKILFILAGIILIKYL